MKKCEAIIESIFFDRKKVTIDLSGLREMRLFV